MMRNLAIGAVVSFFATVFLLSFHESDAKPQLEPQPQHAGPALDIDPGRGNEIQAQPSHRFEVANGSVWKKRVRSLDGGKP